MLAFATLPRDGGGLGKSESALVRSLERDSLLMERLERLMTIPAVGPITALNWALEVGGVQWFSSIKKAVSYCGLLIEETNSSRGGVARYAQTQNVDEPLAMLRSSATSYYQADGSAQSHR